MNTKVVILGTMMTVSCASFAVTGAQNGSKYGTGQDSVDCVQNLSLTSQYAKQGDYKSAADFWEKCYANCPQSSKNIYIYGVKIVAYQLQNEKDPAKQGVLFNKLMGLYDDRAKYFGNDRKMNKNQILADKALDYIKYVPASRDPEKKMAYQWLTEVIDKEGSNCKASVFQNFFALSDSYFKANKDGFRQTYINDYLKLGPLLTERINSGDEKDSANYSIVKGVVDAAFAQSGAADCKTLDGVYASQLDTKKNDKDFLNMVLKLYSIADCEESSVYFKASAYKHAIDPTAGSAMGLAAQAYMKKDRSTALNYFKQAVDLETDKEMKSKLQIKIATIYKELGNYSASREAARAAINYQANNSKAYIIIAMLYAEYNSSIADDATIKQTAYWAAVDKLEKAKAVDPSCAATVNKMISQYKEVFPVKSELFMRNIKEGDSYTVPGWIGEKTTVRGK
ncbi:MAG: hypothetical protein MJZ34_04415 [Paludibacteraceae bacterium]|nr:hypothetical protein [Paludibacteraceae bacterium]